MTMPSSSADNPTKLFWALRDGQCSPEDVAKLEELARKDPDFRKAYIDFTVMCGVLRYMRASPNNTSFAGGESVAPAPLPQVDCAMFGAATRGIGHFASGWPLAYSMATLLLATGLLLGSLITISPPEQFARQLDSPRLLPTLLTTTVGRITGMVDCVWEGAEDVGHGTVGREDHRLSPGRRPEGLVEGKGGSLQNTASDHNQSQTALAQRKMSPSIKPKSVIALGDQFTLRSGLLEITYDTGAKVILQGPVTYKVDSAAGGYLSVGKLTAKLEKKPGIPAHQKSEILNQELFTITTPTAIVTDLGTEFCVEAHKDNTADVSVLSGKVDLIARQGNSRQRLQADGCGSVRAARVEAAGSKGKQRIVPMAFDPHRFVRTMSRSSAAKQTEANDPRVLVQSRFNLSTQGWMASDEGGGLTYSNDAGNPGGCIETGWTPRGANTFYFIASPMFSGNRSAAFGGRLMFDVFTTFVDPKDTSPEKAMWLGSPLVILRSHNDSIATDLVSPIKYGQWNSMSIPLNASGKWYRLSQDRALEGLQTDRTPVSDDTLRAILSNLDSIWIRAEYLHGYDIGRLDNVLLVTPDYSLSGKQQSTTADSTLEPGKNGERVLDAPPQTSPISGTK